MNAAQTMRSALTALAANKMRSALTVLGVVIGVAAVISLMAIGQGSQQAVTENIESLGSDLLFVRPGATLFAGMRGAAGSAATLTLADAEALADPNSAPSVAAVAPEAQPPPSGKGLLLAEGSCVLRLVWQTLQGKVSTGEEQEQSPLPLSLRVSVPAQHGIT